MSSIHQSSSAHLISQGNIYAPTLLGYRRRETIPVAIGDLMLGSDFPIRIQSMTTVDTMDTQGSIEQSIRMIDAGCELVRITAPSVKEAQNLENIRKGLRERGYKTPLVADIHFTPNAAELAARIVEKVRINPGNYADKKRFETIEYTEASYQAELERIRDKFLPLVKICKEYGTAMRIGTNHGSLSDRILSRYGDTPLGMVESALEFLRICEDENYYNIVLSMKASNTQVMVEAYRLLSKKLADGQFKPYPLHLGVTEAGDGEDGRIKSAVGIGSLLEDGLGDTIRVSLTEDPEFEIPVAQELANRYVNRHIPSEPIPALSDLDQGFDSPINPFAYTRRKSKELANFGGHQVPRVLADFSQMKEIEMDDLKSIGHFYLPEPDKWAMNDLGADYLFTGKLDLKFMLPNGLKQIQSAETWLAQSDSIHQFPMFEASVWLNTDKKHASLNFVHADAEEIWSNPELVNALKTAKKEVLVLSSTYSNRMAALRRAFFELENQEIDIPVVIRLHYQDIPSTQFQLFAPTDAGALLLDGFGDGLMLSLQSLHDQYALVNSTNFGILQACRVRISKTEYISCPSCGRTLFDLQETTAKIRQVTDHLKGVKIGIMGCIVNGPGEMADADYGYVGIGKDKIALYRGQEVVKKSVPTDSAVDELIQLIKEDGMWKDPQETNI
ncbi:(E)-4-hydroxy-3-methylbut-2-enyl-diphosphate synthase [Aquirufa rosea]|uniref:4-hydroxy-3-methylbut-2-en-1-yl diphosphate synthase (flavodoxin) n=1 Tax=Aquirufa rosea TaxID=2509241 RepID=A0A4Q1C296_9BACT|nr:(E)-4-hydroxy-3-methylbut-2-enyl-diphosphate synthase [Aquirufa rosea]RXK52350.1 4-hydroxy-3-methylbut-2-en-1-yl diphosphate synthase [Aquirufa rosea]